MKGPDNAGPLHNFESTNGFPLSVAGGFVAAYNETIKLVMSGE